jgi:hypothetical protein
MTFAKVMIHLDQYVDNEDEVLDEASVWNNTLSEYNRFKLETIE